MLLASTIISGILADSKTRNYEIMISKIAPKLLLIVMILMLSIIIVLLIYILMTRSEKQIIQTATSSLAGSTSANKTLITKNQIKLLKALPFEEKLILNIYIHKKIHSITFRNNESIIWSLCKKNILTQSAVGSGSPVTGISSSEYEIAYWAWDYLNKNSKILNVNITT